MTSMTIKLRLSDNWVKSEGEVQSRSARDYRRLLLSFLEKKEGDIRLVTDQCSDSSVELELQCIFLTADRCRQLADKAALQMGYLTRTRDDTLERDSRRVLLYRVEERQPDPDALQDDDLRYEVLRDVEKLIGAGEFKAFARELCRMRPWVYQAGAEDVLYAQRPLLAIGPGCGLDKCLSLLRELLCSCGLPLEEEECLQLRLEPPEDGRDRTPLQTALQQLSRLSGCVVCIDLSAWISHTGEPRFVEFLRRSARLMNHCYTVFRVPYLDQGTLRRIESDLSTLCFVRRIEFPPLTGEEMVQAASAMLQERGLSMDGQAAALFGQRIMREKSSGSFSGFNTIRRVVSEMVYLKLRALSDGADTPREVITSADVSAFDQDGGQDLTGEEMLEQMVGLDELKIQLREILDGISMHRQLGVGSGLPFSLHMCFRGNPGTGKTSAARAVARILRERGVLSVGNFYEINARELCGASIGETYPKTADICRSAYGSVLFIDEAYSLYSGDEGTRDFGREALSTLVSEMENNSSQLVVILAGYPKEMDTMFRGNSGLRSRITWTLDFPNYTASELCEIFRRMVQPPFWYGEEFADRLQAYFESIPYTGIGGAEDPAGRQFGNARVARNLYERLLAKAGTRCKLAGGVGDRVELTLVDLETLLEEKQFSCLSSEKSNKRAIGFGF